VICVFGGVVFSWLIFHLTLPSASAFLEGPNIGGLTMVLHLGRTYLPT
jgi:hypothetical protein